MPKFLKKQKNESLIIEDVVENAENYMKNKSVMIVPVFSGSGIRIKILEDKSSFVSFFSSSSALRIISRDSLIEFFVFIKLL